MKSLLIGVAVIVCGAAAYLFALPPAASAEQNCAEPLDKVVAMIEEAGGELLSLTDVRGVGFDQVLLADLGESLVAGLASEGCMVTPPMPLGGIATEVGV